MRTAPYLDREDAGRKLAAELSRFRDQDPIVLALPRGGVPVASEVARALDAPLEVWVSRKLGAPYQPELGIGAISEGGATWINRQLAGWVGASQDDISRVAEEEARELERRVRVYRGDRPTPEVKGRTVILVDDGIATGGTMRAAIASLKQHGPRRLVVAVPVAPPETVDELAREVDEVVSPEQPADLMAIGLWYRDFHQTSDEEVLELLGRTRPEQPSAPASGP
jgi:putative phosphoribosyl transferase